MIFEDDVKLLGLYSRYQDEIDELKMQIVVYISSDTFGGLATMQAQNSTASSELDDVNCLKKVISLAFEPSRGLHGQEKEKKASGA